MWKYVYLNGFPSEFSTCGHKNIDKVFYKYIKESAWLFADFFNKICGFFLTHNLSL